MVIVNPVKIKITFYFFKATPEQWTPIRSRKYWLRLFAALNKKEIGEEIMRFIA